MTSQRAKDLVFIHSNLHLLSRKTPEYSKGETKAWDIEENAFDSLEVANLSLDDPEWRLKILRMVLIRMKM
ncbi:Dimer_Tnp_hAT domain-containing protein [Cucumis melo var. makuwa]|uniref:Dimer_Tnp_hAT domain-containing protein n=1 Tax=Cucumis melo var. makuwa TaxID=1194695 RepID=A0A5A7T2G1_CUCMM|nr:Dimer_Tnp_hAT domain-containing protein [Cucumis melo var. makuwa]TYK13920.1 Dimer_Tnp_hAT domain-containing protein [Cucumis melo var. makuwa]